MFVLDDVLFSWLLMLLCLGCKGYVCVVRKPWDSRETISVYYRACYALLHCIQPASESKAVSEKCDYM